jgi:hypothetical protein
VTFPISSAGSHRSWKVNAHSSEFGLSTRPPPVITGPQGHGFYTSGPWKIDTSALQNSMAMQLSQPNLIMSDYFNSNSVHPSAPPPDDSQVHGQFQGHAMINNVMLSGTYWGQNYGSECNADSNSVGPVGSSNSPIHVDDMCHDTDADMMMMFM